MDELNGSKTFTESFIGGLGTFARWMRQPAYDGPMGIFEDYDEEDDDPRRYMGSDSDFSDHALGIDY